jgi:hypothetical protein
MYANILTRLIILTVLFCGAKTYAQEKDSVKGKATNDTLVMLQMHEDDFGYKNCPDLAVHIDTTSLEGFQKHEYLSADHPFTARFSNTGLAYRDIVFDAKYSFDFVSSRQYFKNYLLTNENTKYFNVSKPYTDAYYSMGPMKEQNFNVLFTRNFKKRLNFSANYKLIHAPGKYLRQKSDDAFVILNANYATHNSRYVVLGNYFYNRLKIQENGGLQNDSSFTEDIQHNRQYIAVNLNSAENRLRESGFYIKQFYFIGWRKKKENDTLKTERSFVGLGRISHSLSFKNQSYLYIDADPMSGFYQDVLLDTINTHDSIHVNSIENTVEWSNSKFRNDVSDQPFLLRLALKQRYSKIYGYSIDTSFSSLIPEMNLIAQIIKAIKLTADGFYIYGYNKNDFSVSGSLVSTIKKDSVNNRFIGIKGDYLRQSPHFFDQVYSSNNFYWNYSYEPALTQQASLFYSDKTLYTYLSYYNIKNYIYYDNYAQPKQYCHYFEILQFGFNKDFKWKKWEIDNKIVYQKIFDADVLRLPDLMTNHAFYFKQPFFKKALTAEFGMEVTFFSSYYPNAYMPATREFYLQNDFKSDNYPFCDFFVNLKIKRVRIYLKMDHVNSGLMGYNYYMIPHYPMSDRAFKLGLSWIFYN